MIGWRRALREELLGTGPRAMAIPPTSHPLIRAWGSLFLGRTLAARSSTIEEEVKMTHVKKWWIGASDRPSDGIFDLDRATTTTGKVKRRLGTGTIAG
jgi:hypothetical protein